MVFAMNHGQGDPWLQGTVTKQTRPMLYQGHVNGGWPIYRHVDQLHPRPKLSEERGSPRLSSTIVNQQEPVVQSGGGLGDETSTTGLKHPDGPNPLANSRDGLHRSDRQAKHPVQLKDYDCT